MTLCAAGLPEEAIGIAPMADVPGRYRRLFDADALLRRTRSKVCIPQQGGSRNELRIPACQHKQAEKVSGADA